jgi:hypothetical protein
LDPHTKDITIEANKWKQECESALQRECIAHLKSIAPPPPPRPPSPEEETQKSKKSRIEVFFADERQSKVVQPADQFVAQIEIAAYLNIEPLSWKVSSLLWWKRNQHLFPTISQVARRILAIPATSAPVERLFSVGGHIVTDLRHSLSAEHVRSLMFLHSNKDLIK